MDTVISLCSIVIALGALALAVYEGRATRRHNLLSTKPHLSFGCGLKQDAPQVNLKVDNNGLGPAIVKAFDVRLHSKVLAPMPQKGWPEVVRQAGFPPGTVFGSTLNEGDSLAAGQSHRILTVELASSGHDTDQIARWLSNISIKITYESIYAQTFVKHFKLAPQ